MSDNAQTIADLRAAANLIERNGLHQGNYYGRVDGLEPPECPVCSLGGINATVWGHPRGPVAPSFLLPEEEYAARVRRADVAIEALTDHLGISHYLIADWNDTPGRTQEEVISAFRAAADALEMEAAK